MAVAVTMAMAVPAVPVGMRIGIVVVCLPDQLRLVRALFIALVSDAVMRVHVGNERCADHALRSLPTVRTLGGQ